MARQRTRRPTRVAIDAGSTGIASAMGTARILASLASAPIDGRPGDGCSALGAASTVPLLARS